VRLGDLDQLRAGQHVEELQARAGAGIARNALAVLLAIERLLRVIIYGASPLDLPLPALIKQRKFVFKEVSDFNLQEAPVIASRDMIGDSQVLQHVAADRNTL
jgi:hypothetical protein